jgi:hypothetical protein
MTELFIGIRMFLYRYICSLQIAVISPVVEYKLYGGSLRSRWSHSWCNSSPHFMEHKVLMPRSLDQAMTLLTCIFMVVVLNLN